MFYLKCRKAQICYAKAGRFFFFRAFNFSPIDNLFPGVCTLAEWLIIINSRYFKLLNRLFLLPRETTPSNVIFVSMQPFNSFLLLEQSRFRTSNLYIAFLELTFQAVFPFIDSEESGLDLYICLLQIKGIALSFLSVIMHNK